ncbi:sigma-54 interaction domain-containing protein [Chryseobacterium taichungense]|uniref:sigma-54 interaction domain-containing protein n=1 Tax=Chryseobacterium taichungense TaxID=295069 RepID=UPI0028A95B84|nr:sigma 54-interacting transcriptional regulator [Chryseobacterium taichungense]
MDTSDQNRLLTKRLQEMQKEQLSISAINVALSKALDRSQFGIALQNHCKPILNYDEIILLNCDKDDKGFKVFHSSAAANKLHGDHVYVPKDEIIAQCLRSAEPVLFDLKHFSEKKDQEIASLLSPKKTGMRMAVGIALPSLHDHESIVFFLYKNYMTSEDIPERILTAISTQLAVSMRIIKIFMMAGSIKIPHEAENNEVQEIKVKKGFNGIIGESAVMQDIYEQISQVAPSQSGVLIYGETGTGKELIAQAIHDLSSSSHKKMIRINCAAIPSNLIESELFGHEKGSFTGATEQRKGKFELANNSTIFLDEIGELPLELQGRLLRVLQEKEVERIGGSQRIRVNVRIIAATNRNLDKEVAAGKFRSDLFYRLNVFPIELPPLRGRKEDIPLLAAHFLEKHGKKTGKKISGFSQNVLQEMCRNPWPGNIRELENMVQRSIITAKENIIKEVTFPKIPDLQQENSQEWQIKTLQQIEKEHILKVVEKCNGRISGKQGAAVLLGLPSTTLISKMQKLGIHKQHYFKNKD